jgi:hypothetical protein
MRYSGAIGLSGQVINPIVFKGPSFATYLAQFQPASMVASSGSAALQTVDGVVKPAAVPFSQGATSVSSALKIAAGLPGAGSSPISTPVLVGGAGVLAALFLFLK